MSYRLGLVSLANLRGVHPDLQGVVKRAIELTKADFRVIEGLRSLARQRQLVAKGASQTLDSRHLTGHAVDLVPWVDGGIRWDWPLFYPIAEAMKAAAAQECVEIRWGGNWLPMTQTGLPITNASLSRTFPDGAHFELYRRDYP